MKSSTKVRTLRWPGLAAGVIGLVGTACWAQSQQAADNAAGVAAGDVQAGAQAQRAGGRRGNGQGGQRGAGGGISYESGFKPIAEGRWTGPRLSDGQPDIAGDWSNTIANHNNLTDPQGGIPGDPQARNRKLGSRDERAPSRVSDPADGQIPYQPWARDLHQKLQVGYWTASRPEYLEPLSRCAAAGVPMSFYWHGYEIRQYPGYVVFLFGSGWRIVRVGKDEQHLPDNIKLWNGDSIGHWEGNTLVVDVSNLNAKARFGRTAEFVSDNVHVQERYIFDNGNKRCNYVATFTDPTTLTRPFTVTVPARRWTLADKPNGWHFPVKAANTTDGKLIGDHFERICNENNPPFFSATSVASE